MLRGIALIVLSIALIIFSAYQGFVLQRMEFSTTKWSEKKFSIEGGEAIFMGCVGVILSMSAIGIGFHMIRKDNEKPYSD